ncbi:MAG: amidohydrolase [Oscillospiraceae bacterium]|nr:amidohydrolase [Oscillospiraceae bacterium]
MGRKVYYNANIITMDDEKTVQAAATENGNIIMTGTNEEVLKFCKDAQKRDMNGMTIIPAFIDSHGHFLAKASELLSVSLEGCTGISDILMRIAHYREKNISDDSQWIIADGYDFSEFIKDPGLAGEDLDKLQIKNPVVVKHKSGHSGVFNCAACRLLGADPPEGRAYEKEYMSIIEKLPPPAPQDFINACLKAQDIYFSYGITTAQEGMMVRQMLDIYALLIKNNLLRLRINGYARTDDYDLFAQKFPESTGRYHNNFRLMGYKIFLDGSPQLRTAWMRTPYADNGSGSVEYGQPVMTEKAVCDAINMAVEKNMQIIAHCNGDAAAAQFINACSMCTIKPDRPVMIHSQLLDPGQMGSLKKYGIIPSFFIAHIYHWGDLHIKNFGLSRAQTISAAGSAFRNGLPATFHQDTPVIEPDMMETVWCAVNRTTKAGICLGRDERINVYQALEAVTVNAAYQYFDEKSAGSIKVNKKADLAVLSQDPLSVETYKLKDIKVMETVMDGETVYRRSN